MEIDKSGNFKVTSYESFGKLLLEVMYSNMVDERITRVQHHLGVILLDNLLNDEFSDIEIEDVNYRSPILYADTAKDMAEKSINHARNKEIEFVFKQELLDGLELIALREATDLPTLRAEIEVVSFAAEIGYMNERGVYVDSQDVELVKEEIELAEASEIFLEMLHKYRSEKK